MGVSFKSSFAGLEVVDRAPLKHSTAESINEKASLQRIILIVSLYVDEHLELIIAANLFYKMLAEGPIPPVIDITRGVR